MAYSYTWSDDARPLEVLFFGQISRVRLKQPTCLLRLCHWPLCWEKMYPYWGRLCPFRAEVGILMAWWLDLGKAP